MNDLLMIMILIVVLSNFIYSIYSYFSLKKISAQHQTSRIDEKFMLENIIHLRTSINILYTGVAIMTFVLAFLGFNLQKNVSQEVKGEITRAARVDLESLTMKADNIALLESFAQQNILDMDKTKEQVRVLYDKLKNAPQKIYVVEGINVPVGKKRYLFSEFRTIEGAMIPHFDKPPFVFMRYYRDGVEIQGYFNVTTQGIELEMDDNMKAGKTRTMNLWIYAR